MGLKVGGLEGWMGEGGRGGGWCSYEGRRGGQGVKVREVGKGFKGGRHIEPFSVCIYFQTNQVWVFRLFWI